MTIEDIKQVPYLDPVQWPHEIHMGYVTGYVRRLDAEWDMEVPAPAKLQPYIDAVKAAVQKQDEDYKISKAASQTELIAKADEERDGLLGQVLTMVDAMLKMNGLPQMQTAAERMKKGLDIYKPSAKAALRDESTQIQQWLQYVDSNFSVKQAAQTLGLTDIIAQLEAKNNEVIRLMDQRVGEREVKKNIDLKADRAETDRAMKNCNMMMNALALVDDDPERFSSIITLLTGDQAEWKQRYEDNRRANKRVSVKSDVVGNHTYATARDWTWERLIEDGKALLAIDEDDSNRIASTDKKAVKAGGLYLALKGVLVKPSDEVDTEKEYQLIAIDGSSSDGEVTPVTPE